MKKLLVLLLLLLLPISGLEADHEEDSPFYIPINVSNSGLTTTVITGSSTDGYSYDTDVAYLTAHNNAVGDAVDDTSPTVIVGQYYSGSDFTIYRGILVFDTSSIPGGATVINAKMRFVVEGAFGTTAPTILQTQVQAITPPLAVADYDVTNYTTVVGQSVQPTTGSTLEIQVSDLTLIQVGGTTTLSLRTQRDVATTAPSGAEYISIRSSDYPQASSRPTLTVTYQVSTSDRTDFVIPVTVSSDPTAQLVTPGYLLSSGRNTWPTDGPTTHTDGVIRRVNQVSNTQWFFYIDSLVVGETKGLRLYTGGSGLRNQGATFVSTVTGATGYTTALTVPIQASLTLTNFGTVAVDTNIVSSTGRFSIYLTSAGNIVGSVTTSGGTFTVTLAQPPVGTQFQYQLDYDGVALTAVRTVGGVPSTESVPANGTFGAGVEILIVSDSNWLGTVYDLSFQNSGATVLTYDFEPANWTGTASPFTIEDTSGNNQDLSLTASYAVPSGVQVAVGAIVTIIPGTVPTPTPGGQQVISLPSSPVTLFTPGPVTALPLYSVVESAATSMGTQPVVLYALFITGLAIAIGFSVFLFTGQTVLAIMGTLGVLMVGWRAEVIPFWLFFFSLLLIPISIFVQRRT